MLNGTTGQVVKRSLLYSYVLSQPLVVYVDAYPVMDNNMLLEADDMQYGEHGQMVRIVQRKLQTLSYYDDHIDGEYGVFTEYSLKKFQKERGIDVSGEVDRSTKEDLIYAEKQLYLDQLKELSGSVQPGMHNADVEIIQESLKYFGYYEGEIDGIYGPLTTKALEIAEEEHGLSLTDEVTEEDMEQLYEDTDDTQTEMDDLEAEEADETFTETDDIDAENTDAADNVKKTDVDEEDADTEAESEEGDIQQVEAKETPSVIETAQSLIDTPYVWGGDSVGGFDCSGFIHYIYEEQGITTPWTESDIWNFAEPVYEPSVDDVVFFETYQPGPSHMGVYLGNGEFIHASESNGVTKSELGESYWQERYIGAKRIQ